MSATTFEALLVALLALVPGLMYAWGVERATGAGGDRLGQQLPRLFGISVVWLVFLAYPLYQLWESQLRAQDGRLSELAGGTADWWLWPALSSFVLIPAGAGFAIGMWELSARKRGINEGASEAMLLRVLVGADLAPTAWESLFIARPTTYVRLRLVEGGYLLGVFADQSWAQLRNADQDLLLEQTYEIVQEDGTPVESGGELVPLGARLLVRWNEIRYLEVLDAFDAEETPG